MLDRILNFRETFFWKFLLKIQKVILFFCTSACVIILCTEAIFRQFRADLFGYEDILVVCSMWLYFLGASYAMYKKSHIDADMVGIFVKSKKIQKGIKLFVSLFTTSVAIALTIYAYEFFVWTLSKNATTTSLRIPLVYSQSALFFGYLILAFYSLVYFMEDVIYTFTKRERPKQIAGGDEQ